VSRGMRRDANIPATEATRDRPWQLLLTGEGIAQIDAATRQALESILELFTEVEGLVVHTSAGRLRVTRDFSSDYTTQVDRLLGDIFKNNAAVTGIEFLGLGHPRTATPDDPYWSSQGRAYAAIARATARGDITPAEAIAAYRRLAAP
jgi:hypothetical protein